jgi:hypothetical protein
MPHDELIAKLHRLARQQAVGTDFHKGRQLTAENTMYWAAAEALTTMQAREATLIEGNYILDSRNVFG